MKNKWNVILICALCFAMIFGMEVRADSSAMIPIADGTEIGQSLQNNSMTKEEYNAFFQAQEETNHTRVRAATDSMTSDTSCYDPRLEEMVTSVKNQNPYGTCWIYAALAAAESSLIQQGLADASVDLAELQYAYYYWKDPYSKASGEENETYEYSFGKGARLTQAWEYMIQGIGPADESDFGSIQDYKGQQLSDETVYSNLYDLSSLTYVTYSGTNSSAIKNLIAKYGGATIAYYVDEDVDADTYNTFYLSDPASAEDDAYNNTGDATYYNSCYDGESVSHMVEIVGWDDNYPAENFLDTPDGDGAWLVKNSWGEKYYNQYDDNLRTYLRETGEKQAEATGYLWISYYEESMKNVNAVAVAFDEKDTRAREITVSCSANDIYVGDTCQITTTFIPETTVNKNLTYTSSDNKIVMVDENGKVTATGTGYAYIDVVSEDIVNYRKDVNNKFNSRSIGKRIWIHVTAPVVHTSGNGVTGNTILTATIDHESTMQSEKSTMEQTLSNDVQSINLDQKIKIKKVSRVGNNRIKLIWKKWNGVSGYRIQYATNSKFRKAKTIYVKTDKVSKQWKMTSRKKCYIRIQAYIDRKGTRYYSKWTKKSIR